MKATLSLVQIMEICELKDNLTNSARFGGKPFGMVTRPVWRSRKSLILYYNPEWGVESTGVDAEGLNSIPGSATLTL